MAGHVLGIAGGNKNRNETARIAPRTPLLQKEVHPSGRLRLRGAPSRMTSILGEKSGMDKQQIDSSFPLELTLPLQVHIIRHVG